ncbi:MAG: tRNA (adenosine(37)-N6)-dimethylallyltransferase MiaA [Patescibacteria group bacterium]|jgi:tRNA dimethylallyltransferase
MKQKVKQIIVLAGPTASGKTDLAADLIKKYPLEIISADSRQVYRGLDIGSGKDKTVPQFLIDVVNPENGFTVADFKKLAEEKIEQIWQRGNTPLIVGGTGFYIEALMFDQTTNQTPPNKSIRQKLEPLSGAELLEIIARVDAMTASKIDVNNRRRLIRAAEIISATKKPIAPVSHQLRTDARVSCFVLDVPREELYKRIDKRVDDRLKIGMIEEVEHLILAGVSKEWLVSLGLEYRAITRFLSGEVGRDEMVKQLKYDTHAFARRQISYFKRWKFAEALSKKRILNFKF